MRFGKSDSNAWTFHDMALGSEINGGLYTIWDTAASDIYLSVLWYESYVEKLFGSMGVDYSIEDGVTKASCGANYPDIYFLHNGYWQQIKPVDYVREEAGDVCSLRIKPIDAPFNIMGMPAYIGYYIQHNWGAGVMKFAPHSDNGNVAFEPATSFPTQLLLVNNISENFPNGDVIAFAIAFFLCLGLVGAYGYYVYTAWAADDGTYSSDAEAVYYAAGGFVAIFISFFIIRWFLMLYLWPGDEPYPVPSDGDAIKRVKATHMGALGLFSFLLFKLCGKKNQTKQKTAKKEAVETAEIDELINTIE